MKIERTDSILDRLQPGRSRIRQTSENINSMAGPNVLDPILSTYKRSRMFNVSKTLLPRILMKDLCT